MSLLRVKALFWLVVLLVITAFVFEEPILSFLERQKGFRITDIPLQTMAAQGRKIGKGLGGYILFYGKANDCSACVAELAALAELSKSYEEIGFFAVTSDAQTKTAFGDMMRQYKFPGPCFLDVRGKIGNRLGLGDRPLLLFFDSDERLIAIMPLDVPREDRIMLIHRYIYEM